MSKYSIIIPAYNEASVIGGFLDKLNKIEGLGVHEIIIVDDGSTDDTARIVSNYDVKLIKHGNNKGYGAALKTGIRKAEGDIIITLDSDGQHDPNEIPNICRLLEQNDMVIGERGKDSHHVRNRKGGKKLIRMIGEYLVEQKLPDFNSGFRGFHKNLISPMLHIMPNGFSFSTTSTLAFLKEGYTIGTFPIKVAERKGRKSTVRFFKDGPKTILLLMRIIMLFNPMKIFIPGAFIASLAGIIWGIHGFLVFNRFSNTAIILLTLGMFLFFFGLLADQIALLNRRKSN
jgi:glycosyltransferase involved in cell wall biosynthesis